MQLPWFSICPGDLSLVGGHYSVEGVANYQELGGPGEILYLD